MGGDVPAQRHGVGKDERTGAADFDPVLEGGVVQCFAHGDPAQHKGFDKHKARCFVQVHLHVAAHTAVFKKNCFLGQPVELCAFGHAQPIGYAACFAGLGPIGAFGGLGGEGQLRAGPCRGRKGKSVTPGDAARGVDQNGLQSGPATRKHQLGRARLPQAGDNAGPIARLGGDLRLAASAGLAGCYSGVQLGDRFIPLMTINYLRAGPKCDGLAAIGCLFSAHLPAF